jgi:hypothetical protein
MSVIVAKSPVCCNGAVAPVTYSCFPAVTVQQIVPIGSTLTIDGVAVTGFRAAQWFVVVSNGDGSRVRSYQIYGVHRNGSSPAFGYRAILGDAISQTPNVVVSGGFLNLTVSNSDSEDLIVYATRIAVPLSTNQPNLIDVVEVGSSHSYVPAGATQAVDFVNNSDVIAATWVLTVTDATGDCSGSQLFAQLIDGAVITHYAAIGVHPIPFDVIVTEITGLGVELAVRNVGVDGIKVDLTRIPVRVNTSLPYCGPSSGLDLWVPQAITVVSGATVVVDQAAVPVHTASKWLFTAMEATTFNTMACEINATTPSPTTAEVSMWGIVADYLDLNLVTTVSAGNLRLSVTNNEPNAVTVNLLRVPTAA